MVESEPRERARRVVVVTGAASGVGLATVKLLSEARYQVIGLDLADSPPALRSIERLEWIAGDVRAQPTWSEAMEKASRHDPHGPVALISCAAELVIAPFLDTSLDDWSRLYETNVLAVIRGMKTLIPGMVARGHGAVAVVCSVNSFYASSQFSAYSTSKAALLHVVRSAALEHSRDGLRINAVCPGPIDTVLFQRALDDSVGDPAETRQAVERRMPRGAILDAAEIAAVLRFLISDDASGISGAAVMVDGGLTVGYDFDSSAP